MADIGNKRQNRDPGRYALADGFPDGGTIQSDESDTLAGLSQAAEPLRYLFWFNAVQLMDNDVYVSACCRLSLNVARQVSDEWIGSTRKNEVQPDFA